MQRRDYFLLLPAILAGSFYPYLMVMPPIFWVIRLVAQGHPLFLERLKLLVVNVQPGACGIIWHIVPEDVAHVVEELSDREQQVRWSGLALLHARLEKLRIGVALNCCSLKPAIGNALILLHPFPYQVKLAQQVLRPGVLHLCRLMKIFRRLVCVFVYMLTTKILLAQGVGDVIVSVLRRRAQPRRTPLKAIVS